MLGGERVLKESLDVFVTSCKFRHNSIFRYPDGFILAHPTPDVSYLAAKYLVNAFD